MQRAFLLAILISISMPFIGKIIVLKRLSMIGDSLSHSSLAGVSVGLILGVNPVLTAAILSVLAALLIEIIRKKLAGFAEVSIAIITSLSVGIAGVLSGYIKNISSFNSFLFGSIGAVSNREILLVLVISLIIVGFSFYYKRELMYIAFDETMAKVSGVNVEFINFIFTILTALSISIASRIVGALIVSSILVLPVSTALRISNSYKQFTIFSVLFAFIAMVLGIVASFYLAVKPGGAISLISSFIFMISLLKPIK